ncbi:MAG: hypothetical protein NVS3B10_29100 [Polyangiales bacterium]
MQDKQSWAVQGANATLTHYGVAIPIGVGIDYKVAPMLAIGPSFEYAYVAAAGGCAEFADARGNSASQCASAGPDQRVTAAKGYGAWSIGLDVRFTPF